jgi:iron complex transport system substrate-binding protein
VPTKISGRPGWEAIPAVRSGRIVEIKSPLILQPGPAALTDGLDAIVAAVQEVRSAAEPAPKKARPCD